MSCYKLLQHIKYYKVQYQWAVAVSGACIVLNIQIVPHARRNKAAPFTGMTKGRVTNRRVISESYDIGELCSNHAQTTPTFPNDHTQFLNSPDVSLN
jgi:hypothetical protein